MDELSSLGLMTLSTRIQSRFFSAIPQAGEGSELALDLITGYKLVCQFLLPAEIVRHIRLRVCDLMLLVETGVHDKWLPADSVHVILLPAYSNIMDSLGRRPFFKDSSFGRKQEIMTSLEGSHI